MQHLNLIQAIILGIIQGLTEFLPVSSSGHLILVRQVFNFPDPGKTFDIIMHSGTLIALVIYFWKDLADLLKGFVNDAKAGKFWGTRDTNLGWFLVVSTIPGGVFGLLFKDQLEGIRNVYLISGLLIFFGLFLWFSDARGKKEKGMESLTLKDAIIVGLFQALALFPGVSRSGITMTAAMLLGFNRQSAARYSFLISIPLIGGISAYGIIKLVKTGFESNGAAIYAVGLLASVISGFLCIKFLLDYLRRGSFTWFVIYRVAVGLLLIGLGLAGIIN